MTDQNGSQPANDSAPAVPPVPPAEGGAASYDSAPYVPPAAPQYDTGSFPTDAPAYAPPAYAPPTYPTSPYANAPTAPTAPYGAPAAAPYGSGYAAPAAPYGYGGYAPRRTNGLAIAALVLSIVGFVWILPFVGSLAGAIMGHISLGQIKRTGDGGRGMALAGVIVGWAGLALLVIGVLFFVFVFAVSAPSRYSYGA